MSESHLVLFLCMSQFLKLETTFYLICCSNSGYLSPSTKTCFACLVVYFFSDILTDLECEVHFLFTEPSLKSLLIVCTLGYVLSCLILHLPGFLCFFSRALLTVPFLSLPVKFIAGMFLLVSHPAISLHYSLAGFFYFQQFPGT